MEFLKLNVINMQDLVNADQIEETDGGRERQRKAEEGTETEDKDSPF